MGTFDITLPNTQKIIFPPLCVVCEKRNPDSVVKLSFLGVNTMPAVMTAVDELVDGGVDPRYSGGNTSNRIEGIPACKGCSSGLKWYHRLLKFGYYTGWLPGAVLILFGVPVWISVTLCVIGACSPGVYTLMFSTGIRREFFEHAGKFRVQIVSGRYRIFEVEFRSDFEK